MTIKGKKTPNKTPSALVLERQGNQGQMTEEAGQPCCWDGAPWQASLRVGRVCTCGACKEFPHQSSYRYSPTVFVLGLHRSACLLLLTGIEQF